MSFGQRFFHPLSLLQLLLPLLVQSHVVSSVETLSHPLRIFILAGQSNMVGPGSMVHLDKLIHNASTAAPYQHLWNGTDWIEKKNVSIRFDTRHGLLKAGYGSPPDECFGPELEFGWQVGNHLGGTVLLVKTAWGGESLAVDFRPPSSGVGNYTICDVYDSEYEYENHNVGATIGDCRPLRPLDYGVYYRAMVQQVLETLDHLADYVPCYDETQGFELSGLVWFQGWNDVIDWNKVHEYEFNLINLIRDIRLDLSAPDMPIIVGELGQAGVHPHGEGSDRHLAMRRIQQEVTLRDEFRNNTKFVKTSIYVIDESHGESYGGDYHYYGRADTFVHIGSAFGRGMLQLLEKKHPGSRLSTKKMGLRQTSFLAVS